MKRLLVILLVLLCPYLSYGTLFAQIHTASSATYSSYTSSGGLVDLPMLEFRTTSSYGRSMATTRTYSTAPMKVANGVVRTAASSLNGGELLNGLNTNSSGETIIIPVIAGVPDLPLSDGWDIALLLSLLCLGYAVYLKRKTISNNANA